ncbi:hypothetical protein K7W42_19555 [Deinococcus sp. HMF7604]|uniref:hypothetical protein n=1 Tax=Deinococcus betulae TaxID=2873312 RepID=UPI001CCA69CC|nr:hypothetical protein [Deinococcus betulae]MBZ9753038.1 hypothetical protein [Deinococcus betulae]
MSFLRAVKLLLTRPTRARETPRVAYASPRAAVLAFLNDPQWRAESLAQQDNWIRFRYDGVVGEWLDDPDGDWLQLRFRQPITEAQRASELAKYEGWSVLCAQHTLFRWDIDEAAQDYYGDVSILFHEQYNQIECIRLAFNSAKLFLQESNQIALDRSNDFFVESRREPSVALCLWRWFDSPLAPEGTRVFKSTYSEHWFETGSAVCSVMAEQWLYYGRIAYTSGDYQSYMQASDERRLMLYKMHLGLQRWFPRLRNFVLMTGNPANDGGNETSLSIMVSSGTDAAPIFDRMFREFYEQVTELTEWFNFDFNPQTAPWFDHSVKTPQKGYTRQSAPRGMPELAKEHP